MAAKILDTSITDTAARRFLKNAAERDTLWCERITGFHLIKLKSGASWRYRYQDKLGRRRVATVGKYPAMKPQQAAGRAMGWRNDAVDVLSNKEQERREATAAAALAETRELGKYLDGPYTLHQSRKKGGAATLAVIRSNFPDFLERDMASLSKADILQWQAKREAEGRAHATLQRAFGALKTTLGHAVRHEVLAENPLGSVTLERPTDSEREREVSQERAASRRALTQDEIQAFHAGLAAYQDQVRAQRRSSRRHGKAHLPDLDKVEFPHWFVPFAYIAMHTGMRPGDIYSLTWAEVNMRFRRLNKVPEKTRHNPNPARVSIELTGELYEVLHGWWKQQGKPDIGLVFPSAVKRRAGERMDRGAHAAHWNSVKELGGLPADLKFYALRHHFISTLVTNGVPLMTVAKLVGQKSAAMIEKHYHHLMPAAAADALAIFSRSVARSAVA